MDDSRLPVVRPNGVRSVAGWAREDPEWQKVLHSAGAILFRGFGITDVADFEATLGALTRPVAEFTEETSPRTAMGELTFTSTDYPAPYPIQFHNEFSYRRRWPQRLMFCCSRPPASGGATLLADSRQVLRRLPPALVKRFDTEGVQYIRNFTGLGVPWEQAFGTQDRAVVERYCRAEGIEFQWSSAGLHTRQSRAAINRHPVTGERVWFNHVVILSVHGTEPAEVSARLSTLPPDRIPTNCAYGNGDLVEAEVVDLIRRAYAAEAIRFDWQAGDVLLVDNMLMAHAREPFTGARKIIVGMGDAC